MQDYTEHELYKRAVFALSQGGCPGYADRDEAEVSDFFKTVLQDPHHAQTLADKVRALSEGRVTIQLDSAENQYMDHFHVISFRNYGEQGYRHEVLTWMTLEATSVPFIFQETMLSETGERWPLGWDEKLHSEFNQSYKYDKISFDNKHYFKGE